MSLGQRLEIRQGQGLVITPQLQQAIKLLQLSNLELEAVVEAELERNPLLLREDGDGGPDAPDTDSDLPREERGELELSDRDTQQANSDLDASKAMSMATMSRRCVNLWPRPTSAKGRWSIGPAPERAAGLMVMAIRLTVP